MKVNMPVTDREVTLGDTQTIVSKTNLKGSITTVNRDFVTISGYSEKELIGKNHNIVRHPDMPPAAFQDLWNRMKAGKPWTGLVKNRCKNGDYYWVKANVTPVSKDGRVVEYLSVRTKPSREEIQQAESLYRKITAGKASLNAPKWVTWLAPFRKGGIQFRLALVFSVLFVVLTSALTGVSLYAVQDVFSKSENLELKQIFDDLSSRFAAKSELAEALSTLIAGMPTVQQQLLKTNRQGLLDTFGPGFTTLKERYGVEQFQFHTPPATSLARLDQPDKFGDDLASQRKIIVAANERRQPISGLERGPRGPSARGLAPISANGKPVGSVEFGIALDQEFFDHFKQEQGVDIGLHIVQDGKPMMFASTFSTQSLLTPQEIRYAMAGKPLRFNTSVKDQPLAIYAASIADFTGIPLGVAEIRKDRSYTVSEMSQLRNLILGVVTVAVVLCILVAIGIARRLSRRLQTAINVSSHITEGNFHNEIDYRGDDEIGKLMKTLQSMQIKLGYELDDALHKARESGRIRTALDNVKANVMVADATHNIIYFNKALQTMFQEAQADIRKALPEFDVDRLIGANIDAFHSDPSRQRQILESLRGTHNAQIEISGRTFRFMANPVLDDSGERIGTVVEWADRTQELTVEDEVQAMVGTAQAGDLSERIALNNKTGFFASLAANINALVDVSERVISDTVRVLAALARGDLTQTIEADYCGAFGELKRDANATVKKLTEVIGKIKSGADAVANGSGEIAQGNLDLSQRTEEQASSLEQTASSMEQMTVTVKQNADNARQANQLAGGARTQAERGGEVVGRAVDAMGKIKTASKKIAEIIGVIDEIAFQTNLLALNAAVEAARAGEQGRGFAVVAGEVRTLAQRSATAAKEIKELIEDSVAKVDEGSRLVDESGQTLIEIVNAVKKVSDIVAEIAAASSEQSSGIEQVNRAVTQMDEMTQQNAALVEQAAAASQSMGEQARGLRDLVTFFKAHAESESAPNNGSPSNSMVGWTGEERRAANRPWASQSEAKDSTQNKRAQPPLSASTAGLDNDEWEEF